MILHSNSVGDGSPIVLLHGIAGSSRYWKAVVPLLVDHYRVITIDLLGFGRSPHPPADYSYETHIASIKETLGEMGVCEPITLVGHSMGALLALRLATTNPSLVKKLFLINMPIYKDIIEAKRDITQGKKILQYTFYGTSSKILCNVWCRGLRPIAKYIAPLYSPKFPRHVAQDSVLHSWGAFSKSLCHIIERQDVQTDLLRLTVPVALIYGDQETSIVLRNAKKLQVVLHTSDSVSINILKGSHHLPLARPQKIAAMIMAA